MKTKVYTISVTTEDIITTDLTTEKISIGQIMGTDSNLEPLLLMTLYCICGYLAYLYILDIEIITPQDISSNRSTLLAFNSKPRVIITNILLLLGLSLTVTDSTYSVVM